MRYVQDTIWLLGHGALNLIRGHGRKKSHMRENKNTISEWIIFGITIESNDAEIF